MENKQTNYMVPFALMSFLLFLLGFVTWINNILVPFMKDHFNITDSQSNLVSAAFFGAYIISIPVGGFVKKIGYKPSVIVGSLICGGGCMLFLPAVTTGYNMVLGALFCTAIGIVILQVAANPYVIALGSPETSSSRLTAAMAINSAAATLAPIVGSFVLGGRNGEFEHDAMLVRYPFLILGGIAILTAIMIVFMKLPEITGEEEVSDTTGKSRSAWSYPHLILGFIAIGIYMGLEVGPGNFLVKYGETVGIDPKTSARYLAFFPLMFLIGRGLGSVILRKFASHKVLAVNCVIGMALVGMFVATKGKPISIWPILAQGLVLSIMWSVVFDLGLKDVNASAAKMGSGILCTGVVLTGFWMWLMGRVVESTTTPEGVTDYAVAYYFFFAFYAYLIFYALKGSQIRRAA